MSEMTTDVGNTWDRAPEARKPTTTGAITAGKIRERYEKGSKAIRSEQFNYAINHSFMRGEQWVYHHRGTNTIKEVPRDPERVQITANRLWPISRTILAKLTRRDLVFEVPPTSGDDAHRIGAAKAESALSDLARRDNWEDVRGQASRVCWEGGTSIIALDWDKTAGAPVPDPMTGEVMHTGDVKATVLTVAEVATEPGCRDIERSRWWIKGAALPPEDVRCAYPKLTKTPAADSAASLSPAQQRILSDSNKTGTPVPLTLVLTYYERPNPENPNGVVAVVVNNEIVEGPYPWPFPFKDRLNLVCMRETKVHGQWTGDTVVSAAVPVQTALNASLSAIVEHMKLCGNARLMTPMGALDHIDDLSDLASEIVEYVPVNGARPDYLSPPQMPQWWVEQPQMLEREIDDILGMHDVSRGQAPPNIESGAGLSILAEQDDTPVGGMAREIASAFSRLGTLVLETYAVKVNETRPARVQVPGMGPRMMEWTGRDFMGQTVAEVPVEAIMPSNKAASLQRAIQFQQFGLIPPGHPEIFAKVAELDRFEDFTGSVNPDIEKARQENHDMSVGEVALPADFDDHRTHISEHNNFRKSGEYRRQSEEVRSVVDQHVQAHEVLAAEEAAKLQAQAMQAPMLAGAAQGGQPDPAMVQAALGGAQGAAEADQAAQQDQQGPPSSPPDGGGTPGVTS